MIDKIKALSDKTMIMIGILLVTIAIIFFLIASLAYGLAFNRWIDFVYYVLFAAGLGFMMMAYKKKQENK